MEIGSGAFRGCKSLKRIVIPESVTVIEAETFYGCETLREVGWVQKKERPIYQMLEKRETDVHLDDP